LILKDQLDGGASPPSKIQTKMENAIELLNIFGDSYVNTTPKTKFIDLNIQLLNRLIRIICKESELILRANQDHNLKVIAQRHRVREVEGWRSFALRSREDTY
jgi:hypothetical protein